MGEPTGGNATPTPHDLARLNRKPRAQQSRPRQRQEARAQQPGRGAAVLGPLAAAADVTARGEGQETYELRGRHAATEGLKTANALVLFRRCPAVDEHGNLSDDAALRWGSDTNLGQGPRGRPAAGDDTGDPAALRGAVRRRRQAAMRTLRDSGHAVVELRLRVKGSPVLVGAGDAGIRDVGIALHGTYGWPVVPGSALKGAARAWARGEGARSENNRDGWSGDDRGVTFGWIPDKAGRAGDGGSDARGGGSVGAVTFLEALPSPEGVTVGLDVLTPHAGPYYGDDTKTTPPAEYWNPVPVPFLSVCGGEWVTHVVVDTGAVGGPSTDEVATLLEEAVDELGVGAKTAAGYGYPEVHQEEGDQ